MKNYPRLGLNLNIANVSTLELKFSYLGHIDVMVSKNGVKSDKKKMKIEAMANWPTPVTVTDVRSLLGLTNSYV